jgi:hypothetical protein
MDQMATDAHMSCGSLHRHAAPTTVFWANHWWVQARASIGSSPLCGSGTRGPRQGSRRGPRGPRRGPCPWLPREVRERRLLPRLRIHRRRHWRHGHLELHAWMHALGDEDAYAAAVGGEQIERHARGDALRDGDPQVKARRLTQHRRHARGGGGGSGHGRQGRLRSRRCHRRRRHRCCRCRPCRVRRRQGAAGRGRRIAPRSGDGDADEDGGARTCMLLESEDRWEGA